MYYSRFYSRDDVYHAMRFYVQLYVDYLKYYIFFTCIGHVTSSNPYEQATLRVTERVITSDDGHDIVRANCYESYFGSI
jgi:hypothetical protein